MGTGWILFCSGLVPCQQVRNGPINTATRTLATSLAPLVKARGRRDDDNKWLGILTQWAGAKKTLLLHLDRRNAKRRKSDRQ